MLLLLLLSTGKRCEKLKKTRTAIKESAAAAAAAPLRLVSWLAVVCEAALLATTSATRSRSTRTALLRSDVALARLL